MSGTRKRIARQQRDRAHLARGDPHMELAHADADRVLVDEPR